MLRTIWKIKMGFFLILLFNLHFSTSFSLKFGTSSSPKLNKNRAITKFLCYLRICSFASISKWYHFHLNFDETLKITFYRIIAIITKQKKITFRHFNVVIHNSL